MTLTDALKKIESAVSPAVLFPNGQDAKKIYHELAKLCHPDVITDARRKKRAVDAMAKLATFYGSLNGKSKPTKVTMLGKWAVTTAFEKGDIADLYLGESKSEKEAIIKIARNSDDNELLEREGRALKELCKSSSHKASAAFPAVSTFAKYIPKLLDTFEVDERRVNVLSVAPITQFVSLAFIQQHYDPLDFRHIVWMTNRSLNILGHAHRHGIVHGAVLPKHLLFGDPLTKGEIGHGLVLVDWCCSVQAGKNEYVPLMVKGEVHLYPPEIKKKKVHPSTDLYMLMKVMAQACRNNIPVRFRAIFEYCTAESYKARPDDAIEVQKMWKELAEKEYGKPTYVPLPFPGTN